MGMEWGHIADEADSFTIGDALIVGMSVFATASMVLEPIYVLFGGLLDPIFPHAISISVVILTALALFFFVLDNNLQQKVVRAMGGNSSWSARRPECSPDAILDDRHSVPKMRDETAAAMAARRARESLRLMRVRDRIIQELMPATSFGEHGWRMMLDLFIAKHEGSRISVSSLCVASDVPSTTALRQITILVQAGVFERHADDEDRRRVFLTLSDAAEEAVQDILDS